MSVNLGPRIKKRTYRLGLANVFCGRMPKLPITFEEILSPAHGNFEEQNKALESSMIIIINYCTIIINA